jgi:esterase/lipase superfamily enzyme
VDPLAYTSDEDRIAASEDEIADFLMRIADDAGATRVHLLAHSMGSRGLARAAQRIAAGAASSAATAGVRFGEIILAAPDVEVSLFRDLARHYQSIAQRTTMYVSAKDKALHVSGLLHGSVRAGFPPPITVVPGIDTIEVTDVAMTLLGHGYFAEAEPVLHDMHEVLRHSTPPDKRPRLRPVPESGAPEYWRIGR